MPINKPVNKFNMDKKAKNISASEPVAEYMKIRRFVINLIHRNSEKSIQLPTIKELAEKFGVSRQTVGKAMKQLTDDGFVIGKPGIGSFTNPDRTFSLPEKAQIPIIGVIISDGRLIHFNEYHGKMLAALAQEIVMYPAYLHIVSLGSSDPEEIYRNIQDECLDGLIWSNPHSYQDEIIQRLSLEGYPLVTCAKLVEGVSGARFDYEQAGYECGKLFLAEGRRNLVFLGDKRPWNLPADGIRRAYEEAGVPLNPKLFLPREHEILEKLRSIVELGMPVDAVYNPEFLYNEVRDILVKGGIDPTGQCRMACCEMIADHDPEYCGIVQSNDLNEKAREAVRLLRIRMEHPESACIHSKLPLTIQMRRPKK